MKVRATARLLMACWVLLLGLPAWAGPDAAAAYVAFDGPRRAETLVIARTGNNPAKLRPRLQALVDYIVGHLEGTGIRQGVALATSSNAELLKLLRQGRVDLIPDTLFTALLFRELGGAEIFLREWRDGVPTYSTMFVVRANSDIRRLEDLRDRRIAFEDEGSTSAFRLPLAMLKRNGLSVDRLADPADIPAAGTAGYLFAGNEHRIVQWVAAGVVDAGAISNVDWVKPEVMPSALRARLRIVTMTEPIVRSVLTLRGGLDPRLRAELKRVLLAMDESEEGRAILKSALDVMRYDEFTGKAQQQLDHSIDLLLPVLDESN